MNYTTLLNNFSTPFLQRAIEEEIIRLTFMAKIATKHKRATADKEIEQIKHSLLRRWNCLFISKSSKGISAMYKAKAWVTLATVLHKNGYADAVITDNAIRGLNLLYGGRFELLTEHQDKKIQQAIDFLSKPPAFKNKIPKPKSAVTQYRARDLLSIEIEGAFYVALVVGIETLHQHPCLQLLTQVFSEKPSIADIKNWTFQSEREYMVCDLHYLPDPANQFQLIDSQVNIPTERWNSEITDIYRLTDKIVKEYNINYK